MSLYLAPSLTTFTRNLVSPAHTTHSQVTVLCHPLLKWLYHKSPSKMLGNPCICSLCYNALPGFFHLWCLLSQRSWSLLYISFPNSLEFSQWHNTQTHTQHVWNPGIQLSYQKYLKYLHVYVCNVYVGCITHLCTCNQIKIFYSLWCSHS